MESETKRVLRKETSTYRKTTSIPKFKRKEDTPVWLNSFLSIFVPSCSLDLIDPGIVNNLDVDKDFPKPKGKNSAPGPFRQKTVRIKGQLVVVDVYNFNKSFQRKVIRRQVLSSSLIILATVVTVWYRVNYNYNLKESFNYHPNIFPNEQFNLICYVLGSMSILSAFFFRNIDIFDTFALNKRRFKTQDKRDLATEKPVKKTVAVLVSTIVLLSPGIVGFFLTFSSLSPSFIHQYQEGKLTVIKTRTLRDGSSNSQR